MLGLRGINIKYILFCNHYLRHEQELAMNIVYFTCYDDKSDICKMELRSQLLEGG